MNHSSSHLPTEQTALLKENLYYLQSNRQHYWKLRPSIVYFVTIEYVIKKSSTSIWLLVITGINRRFRRMGEVSIWRSMTFGMTILMICFMHDHWRRCMIWQSIWEGFFHSALKFISVISAHRSVPASRPPSPHFSPLHSFFRLPLRSHDSPFRSSSIPLTPHQRKVPTGNQTTTFNNSIIISQYR